jgi:putative thioredoxin
MNQTSENSSPWIVETSEETFERDVIQRSEQIPVVVDFWAAWCQPCRLLTPLLEELAEQYSGRFVLVKAETDHVPRAAAQFNVQSIPAVYAVYEGQVRDFFVGVLSPPQLREWIDRLLLSALVGEARRLEETDPAAAESKYRTVMEQSPNSWEAPVGLARLLSAQRRDEESRALIDQLERRGFLEPEAEKVKAELDLRSHKGADVDALRASAQAQPDDLELQLKLGQALAADGQYDEALQTCLAIVQKDRAGVGERARQTMVDVFRVLPDDSQLLSTYRRNLSTALY